MSASICIHLICRNANKINLGIFESHNLKSLYINRFNCKSEVEVIVIEKPRLL